MCTKHHLRLLPDPPRLLRPLLLHLLLRLCISLV
jgi:hypothetical protein